MRYFMLAAILSLAACTGLGSQSFTPQTSTAPSGGFDFSNDVAPAIFQGVDPNDTPGGPQSHPGYSGGPGLEGPKKKGPADSVGGGLPGHANIHRPWSHGGFK